MIRTILGVLILGATLSAAPLSAQSQSTALMAEGAQIYGRQCVRCHNARSPMERTDREWLTIVNHMRARANLTRAEARALVFFLQATNGDGTMPEAAPAAGQDRQGDTPEEEGSDDGEGTGGGQPPSGSLQEP